MTDQQYKVRRATTEDITQLIELWRMMRYPAEDLSRRVTEFQVIEEPGAKIIGAAGVEISGRQGRIHSESFLDFAQSDQMRTALWERVQTVANNHGLANIWTQEQAPFWRHLGFGDPSPEAEAKFPATWRTHVGKWLVIKLREDLDAVLSADQEFSMFMQAEKARTQQTIRNAKALKTVATILAGGLFIVIILAGWFLIRNSGSLR